MLRKKTLPEQAEFWISREDLPRTAKDGFYDRLAADLDRVGFGDTVRELCAPHYSAGGAGGRPPIDPEVYFKMLVVGFFEGIGSERGIASRCEDSISLRRFLRYDLTEATPDHSSLSRIQARLPEGVFAEAFALSLRALACGAPRWLGTGTSGNGCWWRASRSTSRSTRGTCTGSGRRNRRWLGTPTPPPAAVAPDGAPRLPWRPSGLPAAHRPASPAAEDRLRKRRRCPLQPPISGKPHSSSTVS